MAPSTLTVDLKDAVKGSPNGFEKINIKHSRGGCGSMEISFRRTIRVPDDGKSYQLPPNLGKFPIYCIGDYADKLPVDLVRKGGVFIPIWQREALWIRFSSKDRFERFAVRVYVGGINILSGENKHDESATKKKPCQDYVIVPGQQWIDGVVRDNGKVMQFVAVPVGSGYSVEAQITGADNIAGLQFEIVPFHPDAHFTGQVYVKTLTGTTISLLAHSRMTIDLFKHEIYKKEGIPPDQQRLIFSQRCWRKVLENDYTLWDYGIREGMTIFLVLNLRGGGLNPSPAWMVEQMIQEEETKRMEEDQKKKEAFEVQTLAPGGSIHQAIRRDHFNISQYDKENTVMFNVQFIGPKTFHQVTGMPPPQSPVSAETYAKHGYPFFEMYNEPRAITGTFGELLKSVGSIDKEKKVNLEVHDRERNLHFRSVKLNTVDKISNFTYPLIDPTKKPEQ